MVNYLLILVGIISIIIGSRFLLKFIFELTDKIERIEKLLEDERFSRIECVSKELDELNYSYYEILNDISNRMDALVEQIDQGISETSDSSSGAHIDLPSKVLVKKNVSSLKESDTQSERKQILAMIDAGFDDNQIAKALGIGSGKVDIIRNLNNQE